MKKKLQLFLMIFCFGLMIIPKQMLLAQQTTMECCAKATSKVKSCHSDKKNSNAPAEKKSCTGDCCTSCASCTGISLPAIQPVVNCVEIPHFIQQKTKAFTYIEPTLSTDLKEIWQPPKIS